MARYRLEIRPERSIRRATATPLVEVTHQYGGVRRNAGNVGQCPNLDRLLAAAKSEMRADNVEFANRGGHPRPDSLTRFVSDPGKFMDALELDRMTTGQHVPVSSGFGFYRCGKNGMWSGASGEQSGHVDVTDPLAPGVDFLQRNDIGIDCLDYRGDLFRPEPAPPVHATVQVPGQ